MAAPTRPRPRTGSRVAAVQALFQAEQGPTSPETVIDEFVRYRLGATEGDASFDDGRVNEVDVKLFARIVRTATTEQDRIDAMLSDALSAEWPSSPRSAASSATASAASATAIVARYASQTSALVIS